MPIATAVSWFSDHAGGELVYYKSKHDKGTPHPTPFNSAIVLDTDSIYHGVDPTGGLTVDPPVMIARDLHLVHKGEGQWMVTNGDGTALAGYDDLGWSDIRMSVQWKAYCFRDEEERRQWKDHTDDIAPAAALKLMIGEMVRDGGTQLQLQQRGQGNGNGNGNENGNGNGNANSNENESMLLSNAVIDMSAGDDHTILGTLVHAKVNATIALLCQHYIKKSVPFELLQEHPPPLKPTEPKAKL